MAAPRTWAVVVDASPPRTRATASFARRVASTSIRLAFTAGARGLQFGRQAAGNLPRRAICDRTHPGRRLLGAESADSDLTSSGRSAGSPSLPSAAIAAARTLSSFAGRQAIPARPAGPHRRRDRPGHRAAPTWAEASSLGNWAANSLVAAVPFAPLRTCSRPAAAEFLVWVADQLDDHLQSSLRLFVRAPAVVAAGQANSKPQVPSNRSTIRRNMLPCSQDAAC